MGLKGLQGPQDFTGAVTPTLWAQIPTSAKQEGKGGNLFPQSHYFALRLVINPSKQASASFHTHFWNLRLYYAYVSIGYPLELVSKSRTASGQIWSFLSFKEFLPVSTASGQI